MDECRCCLAVQELSDVLTMFHEWGNERDAVGMMTESQLNRYHWALVQAKDRKEASDRKDT